MTIIMYDLAAAEDRRPSPFCWRTRMALAHKGLDCETRPTMFREIPEILGGGHKTVPVIVDGDRTIADSWAIAEYLEDTYPDAPSLFGGAAGKALTRFVDSWVATVVHAGLITMVVKDIHDHVDAGDKPYFRSNREQRFGKPLEEVVAGRDERLPVFRQNLFALRHCLRNQPFLGGDQPLYADYIAFGAFQWARAISDFRVVETDDPIWNWLERCRDLHGGIARASTTCY